MLSSWWCFTTTLQQTHSHLIQNSVKYVHMYTKISVHNQRGRPRHDEVLQQQVRQFIQGIRAEVEEARDGDNACAFGDAPAQVNEPQPQQQQAGCNCETGFANWGELLGDQRCLCCNCWDSWCTGWGRRGAELHWTGGVLEAQLLSTQVQLYPQNREANQPQQPHLEAEGPGPGLQTDLGCPRTCEAIQPRDGTLQTMLARKIFYTLRTKSDVKQADGDLWLVSSQVEIFFIELYVKFLILCSFCLFFLMFGWVLSLIVSNWWVSRPSGHETVQCYSWRIKFRSLFLMKNINCL